MTAQELTAFLEKWELSQTEAAGGGIMGSPDGLMRLQSSIVSGMEGLQQLCMDALCIDGEAHKQGYLVEIFRKICELNDAVCYAEYKPGESFEKLLSVLPIDKGVPPIGQGEYGKSYKRHSESIL